MWEILKKTERFSFVPENKVTHVPIGKAKVNFFFKSTLFNLVSNVSFENDVWVFENTQWKIAIQKVRDQINSSEEFGLDDIIIFADVDEMLSREVLYSLKHCQLRHGVLSGAIIMPMGNFDLAFR